MRLFIAVRIDPDVARIIAKFGERLRQHIARHVPSARLTWVSEDHLHVTVRFIGDVNDVQRLRIQDALTPAVDVHPFEVLAAEAGVFPRKGAPRVLWVGITEGRESLAALEQDVSTRLALCRVDRDDRLYSPHITLARVKDSRGLRARTLFDGAEVTRFGEWRVDAITLFESRPSPRGHQYVSLQTTPLAR